MEAVILALVLALTILVPINGLILIGIIRHRALLEEKHRRIKNTIAIHQKAQLRRRTSPSQTIRRNRY